jgi:hypothetical protein
VTKNRYAGVYVRRQKLWIKYYDAAGEVVRESTGLPIGKEKQAAEIGDVLSHAVRELSPCGAARTRPSWRRPAA